MTNHSLQFHVQVHQWCTSDCPYKQPRLANYLDQMYPVELQVNTSVSYQELLLSMGREGHLHTSISVKCDAPNFHITSFPFLRSNIPSSPAYNAFISKLIRYVQACFSCKCFILRVDDFPISHSNKETSWYAWNRDSGSFMVDTGILLNDMMSPSRNGILRLDQLQWLPNR